MDIQTRQILQQTARYFAARQRQAYLVGGSLRNTLLGEACSDWDIVVMGEAHRLARALADMLGGHYARLHDKASRVIVKAETGDITLDITSLHGLSLEDDLRARDFTINAMAAPLDETLSLRLIDPLHGEEDLRKRRLRAVNDGVFQVDPLRMLRAARLMARYSFSLDNDTQALIRRDAALLPMVAPERIHDELYAILAVEGATAHLRLLDELGLLTVLIPEFMPAKGMRQPNPHYWDVFEHSLETVGALELVAWACAPDVQAGMSNVQIGGSDTINTDAINRVPTGVWDGYARLAPNAASSAYLAQIQSVLREAEEQGVFSLADLTAPRMKMAALLHDIGKPVTYSTAEDGSIRFYTHPQAGAPIALNITRRLSASTKDRRLAQLVAAHHMRPGQLGQDGEVTPRAIRRYFVDLGPAGIAVALFSLADHLATFGPQPLTSAWERHLSVVSLLLTRYIRQRDSILPPRLLSPEELMRRLKLEPGPLVGQLLEAIAEAQSEGTIHSKEEALWLAEERLSALNGD
ncbi:MAG TPA: HD domain-containing protein [Ktedonobacteraceae bacterium]|nr:HD domain-containing protein [Ktedonobacteraceae bacterium]